MYTLYKKGNHIIKAYEDGEKATIKGLGSIDSVELIILLENLIYAEKSVSLLASEDDYISRLIMETVSRYKKHVEEVKFDKYKIIHNYEKNDKK